jgi:hypothetical protein
MAKLSLKTQNTRGGNPLWKERLGYTANFLDGEGNIIICDTYEGQGKQRKERKVVNIELYRKGKLIFEGTFNQLANIIYSHNQISAGISLLKELNNIPI